MKITSEFLCLLKSPRPMFAPCCYPTHPPLPAFFCGFPVLFVLPWQGLCLSLSLPFAAFPSPSLPPPSPFLGSWRRVLFGGTVCDGWGPAPSSAALHYISKCVSKYISHALSLGSLLGQKVSWLFSLLLPMSGSVEHSLTPPTTHSGIFIQTQIWKWLRWFLAQTHTTSSGIWGENLSQLSTEGWRTDGNPRLCPGLPAASVTCVQIGTEDCAPGGGKSKHVQYFGVQMCPWSGQEDTRRGGWSNTGFCSSPKVPLGVGFACPSHCDGCVWAVLPFVKHHADIDNRIFYDAMICRGIAT